MRPAKQDQRDIGLGNAILLGDLALRHRSTKQPDFSDFFAGQQLLETRDTADVDSVLLIAGIAGPFEIRYDVVRFDAINVVDHRETARIWDESNANKSVNVDRFAFPISEKIELAVSKFVDAMFEDLTVASLQATRPHPHSIEASYSTEVADLVEVSEVRDRNGSQFFCESGIHVTGCPSGDIGSAIKDPSHASTSAGPSIMDEASSTYNRRLRFL
jgi:hypothetical protein